MNMIQNIKPTPAEEKLGFLLPTRRVESWHYTDLRAMLADLPETAGEGEFSLDDHDRLIDAWRLSWVNGRKQETGGFSDVAGIAVETTTAETAIEKVDDAIAAMAALAESVTAITISGNELAEKPLALIQQNVSSGFVALHHQVLVKEDANAKIIDRHVSPAGKSPVTASQVDLTLEKGASASWFIVQQESAAATRLARLNVTLHEGAELTVFVLNAGGKLVRQEVHVDVLGENAQLVLKGVNLVGEGAHIDVTTALNHKVPHTNAEELFRNVVTGKGKGVFQGQINVAQPAQKTDAQMACNTLLLTDDSDFSAKPELEIFADDVICAHGATITDIEDDHLFYLRARGIDEKTARTMLIKAFVDEVVDELEAGELGEGLTEIIDTWLDANV